LDTVLERAGIRNFRWHDMRHCFGSYLAMAGVDLFGIQRLMGHSNITMTMRYAHLAPRYLEESIGKLEGFVTPALLPAAGRSAEARSAPFSMTEEIECVTNR